MNDTYERRGEKRFCYFIKEHVAAIFIYHRWMLGDGTWQEEEKSIECPMAAKCRKAEHNCSAIHPESGIDPFIAPRNLLADLW
jgi:hypothetical protein